MKTKAFSLTLLTLLVVAGGPLSAGELGCEAAQQWLAQHRELLPDTYGGLLAYRPELRRVAYGELTAIQKSSIWAEHLESYLDDHPELSADQRAVVFEALDLVSDPMVFDLAPDDVLWKARFAQPLQDLQTSAGAVFSGSETREILAALGSDTGSSGLVPVPAPSLDTESASASPICTCSTQSDFCGLNQTCLVTTCERQNSGCGFLWLYTCNGLCFID